VKLAVILLVSIGGVCLIVMFAFMRRRMEQLRRWHEEND
jgi:uncharacterized protein involved in exopolysaccharide biosynthesis